MVADDNADMRDYVRRLLAADYDVITAADGESALATAQNLKPDLVLVDPPRAGLERAAREAILAMSPAVLVYISCDPSTLARDGRRLNEAGYRLRQVTPFDLFPQTFHIESISFWEK